MQIGTRITDADGVEYEVLAVHDPLIVRGQRRGEAVTILRLDEGRAYFIEVAQLTRSGFSIENNQPEIV